MRKALFAMAVSAATFSLGASENCSTDLRRDFDQKYAQWQQYLSRPEIAAQPQAGTRFTCAEFRAIVRLGLPALPYIVEKMEREPDARLLWRAVSDIAKVRIRPEYDAIRKKAVFPDYPDLDPTKEDVYVRWWHEGRVRTRDKFAELRSQWKSQLAAGNDAEAGKTRRIMLDLGIAALPAMEKMIAQGDTDLIPIMSELTDGKVTKSATKEACATWWAENKEKWTLPPLVEQPDQDREQDQANPPPE